MLDELNARRFRSSRRYSHSSIQINTQIAKTVSRRRTGRFARDAFGGDRGIQKVQSAARSAKLHRVLTAAT
jgi:hypothetical protein